MAKSPMTEQESNPHPLQSKSAHVSDQRNQPGSEDGGLRDQPGPGREDDAERAQRLDRSGRSNFQGRRYTAASRDYGAAARLYQQERRTVLAARSRIHQAACFLMVNDPDRALEILGEAESVIASLDDPQLRAALAGNRGLARAAQGEYQQAAACHKQVLEIGEGLGDDSLRLQAQIHLADSYLGEGRTRQALGFALVARDLAQTLDRPAPLVKVHNLLGLITARRENHQSALEHLRTAQSLAQKTGSLPELALSLANQALSQEALTNNQRAVELMTRALDLMKQTQTGDQNQARRDLDRMKSGLGRPDGESA